MTIYHKLVRDRIPEIIAARGKTAKIHEAGLEEFKKALAAKLVEEASEFSKEPSAEEIADLLEVIEAIIECFGFQREEIERIRAQKAAERGGFKKRIILEES